MKTFIIAALTADGFIAKSSNHPATWTSPVDKKFFIEKTKQAGVIIMGSKTYATIGKPLPGRLNVVYAHSTNRSEYPEEVMATDLPPAELLASLAGKGYQEVAIGGGTSIYTMFMRAGLVDTLYLTIEPKLFGQGLNLFSEVMEQDLELREIKKLDDQVVLLEYALGHSMSKSKLPN
ncbi:MAG: dihydrofolate reductase family protein [Patescibacteria group bacterium]|nr:dihydrofolate reductase family protein [Patescibacteria group bacterium]